MTETNPFANATVIVTYTRAQAIADGVLVDVTGEARKRGFKIPVAVTERVWNEVVVPPRIAEARHETETGRLADILNMLLFAIQMHRGRPDEVRFRMIATNDRGRKTTRRLWAKCGPGDTAAPVITIMAEGED